MRLVKVRYWWCTKVGHRWRRAKSGTGQSCLRCGDWRPTYAQRFRRVEVSGLPESQLDATTREALAAHEARTLFGE